ncbi:MAG: hypothetical protein WD577_11305 [Bacteroidales bacterium]
MFRKIILRFCTMCIVALAMHTMVFAETIGVFYDSTVEQIEFAAGDVKAALESKSLTVEMRSIDQLNAAYANKKVIIALATDTRVKEMLTSHGVTATTGLGKQAYALRTTTQGQSSYWALGGDNTGAMYGGLQLAENFKINGFTGTYNEQESPAILKRGIKLNLPFDKESGTYGAGNVTSKIKAIPNVWDMTFWTSWFDTMARYRYNVLTIWSNHPFTSMIKMPEYPDVAIQDVTGLDGYKKSMSIDEKIEFWRDVMAYAKSRGFEFYLFNWNIFTDGATGKYGITDEQAKAATNQATIDYMRKCMSTLLETYPDLDGFGITQGEHMSWHVGPRDLRPEQHQINDALFLAKTYGMGMADYAKLHPERKLTFIHRWHLADFTDMKENFAELMKLPNITFELSYKYSLAHMYSIPLPERMNDRHITPLREHNLKSWLNLRNDDFYYHNWGDPDFARAYINGMINKGKWFAGFYMGADGYTPTRTFFSKNSVTQGILEVQRQWYMYMLWGRLSYNPNTRDDVFKNIMAVKYPEVSSEELFTAWKKASEGFPLIGEMITGTLGRDNQWWPEACQSNSGFLTVEDFGNANPNQGSALASIAETASGNLDGKRSAYDVADEIEASAKAALSFAKSINADTNTRLGITINNIKAMSYLANYYAYKIRGATYLMANEKEKAKISLGEAYGWWMNYSNLMDDMYTGMDMARTEDLPDWHVHDQLVLKEYTDLGGTGIPSVD